MTETCYMCDQPATSREHAPPKGLFPARKDLPDGEDLRKALISVPSCDEHNLGKSKDDQYSINVLMMCHAANAAGQRQFQTKGMRAIKRNPSLVKHFLANSAPAYWKDARGVFETRVVSPDGGRLDSFLEQLGRAIYFHHFDEKWLGPIKLIADFLFFTEGESAGEKNEARATLHDASMKYFAGRGAFGDNPDIFRYKVSAKEENPGTIMRAEFYGDAGVTFFFLEEDRDGMPSS